MTQGDYKTLESLIFKTVATTSSSLEDIENHYKAQKLSSERMRWDLYWHTINLTQRGKFGPKMKQWVHDYIRNNYLNDNHVNTALKRIIGDY